MKIDVLIIIVTYNGEKWIKSCVDSLIEDPASDIIIIDCDSKDNTRSILETYGDGIIKYFSDTNLGFGKANNIGLRYAIENDYKYVFLINQDTKCESGLIQKLKSVHQKFPEYGILSPMHFFDNRTLDSRFENHLKESSSRTFSLFLRNEKLITIDFVNAAFWFIPIGTVNKIGGFDPIFNHYGEDDDYVNRVKYAGNKIGILTTCKAFHLRNQSLKENEMDIQSFQERYFNNYLVILKNPNNTFFNRFILLHKRLIYNLIKAAISFDIHNLMGNSLAYLMILTKINAIIKHRRLYSINNSLMQNVKHKNNLFYKTETFN